MCIRDSFDGELSQRHGQLTELEDDAAHVQRTSNEVLIAHCADVEPVVIISYIRLFRSCQTQLEQNTDIKRAEIEHC